MAILTQTVPASADPNCILTSIVNDNYGAVMTFGNAPQHQAFREITSITHSPTGEPLIKFDDITITGNSFSNFFASSFLSAIGRTRDTYKNFTLSFAVPIRLTYASIYSNNNSEGQKSKYDTQCHLKWEEGSRTYTSAVVRALRRMFGLSLTIPIPETYSLIKIFVSCRITAAFSVDNSIIEIIATMHPIINTGIPNNNYTPSNPFTKSYYGIEITCESVNPIRIEDPAIFKISNTHLKLTGQV